MWDKLKQSFDRRGYTFDFRARRIFNMTCKQFNIEATKRQYNKWCNKRGIAYKHYQSTLEPFALTA